MDYHRSHIKILMHSEAKYVLFITKNQPVAHQPGTALNTIGYFVSRFVNEMMPAHVV